ncbi:MAG: hypothetical protein ACTSVY_14320 [Candidatus Helarchaeota archaeon]
MNGNESLIENVIFIKTGGIAFITLNENHKYIELIPSYLEAIKSFTMELGNLGDLRSIKLSKLSLSYFSMSKEYSIILIHDTRIPIEILTRIAEEINNSFLQRYSEDILKTWKHNISQFEPFKEELFKLVKVFNERYSKIILKNKDSLDVIIQGILKNSEILAFTSVDLQGKAIQTTVNTSLDDFEIQTFISSPYLNRTLINLLPMLQSVGNILINEKGSFHVVKTEKFYLGMKEKNKKYFGLIGTTKESILKEIIKI